MKRIAIAGFGFMGMTHAINILKIKGLSLTAVVERDPAIIDRNLASGMGNISTGSKSDLDLSKIARYTDMDECLQCENIDALIVCTHVDTHFEIARKAILSGAGVFVEKPLCIDPAEAAELVSLAQQNGKLLMTGHVVRFMEPYIHLKRMIDSREYGDLKFLSLTRFCGLPGWGQWNEKNIRDLSGGALFDLVIHDIDYAASVAGLPADISSWYLAGEYSSHDYVSALWDYAPRELRVKIEGGFTYHKAFPFNAGFMARFEKASVIYSTLKGDIIQVADDKNIITMPSGDAAKGYYNEMEYFAECLEKGSEPVLCHPSSTLQSIELCHKHIKH